MSDSPKQFIKRFIGFSMGLILSAIIRFFTVPISVLMIDTVDMYIVVILSLLLPFAVIDRFNLLLIRMEEKAMV